MDRRAMELLYHALVRSAQAELLAIRLDLERAHHSSEAASSHAGPSHLYYELRR